MTLHSTLADANSPVATLTKLVACKALIDHELAKIADHLANVEQAAIEMAKAAAEMQVRL